MKVAFDAQLLFEKQKTGIGWNARHMIDELIQIPDMECTLNCFRIRDREHARDTLKEYRERGCQIRQSTWIPARIYNHLERLIPFPYQWIFGKDAEITQFFNYTVPLGVANKKVTIVHDMAFRVCPDTVAKKTRKWLGKNLEKYCQRASCIVTVSEFSKREIHQYLGIPLEKIEVVYNGVDQEMFHPNYDNERISKVRETYKTGENYLLYLGTLEPRKNLETLIDAYRRMRNRVKDCPKLVLAGKKGWLYDSIFEMVKDYGLERDVVFTGYIAENEVAPLICGARIFLFPSLYEGFGIPPLEAMACGTPVITSDTSSLPEVVGDAGIMIPPKEPEKLCEAMERLFRDDVLWEEYRVRGFAQAKKFTWKNSAEKLAGIYRRIV